MNHDNPMTIRFVGDEMTLKATLFVCVLIVISKTLVSCVTCLEERLWPSMTSMGTSVLFFMKIILCHCISSMSVKHVDTPESNNALVSIIMGLLYLIVISNKKQSVRSKSKLGPFWAHDASKSSFVIFIKTRRPRFLSLQEVACEWKWLELMW
jgi:hypothetical protein